MVRMKPASPQESPPPPPAHAADPGGVEDASLEVEVDARAGLIRVSDARLFRPLRRDYARRLLEALCKHPGVRKAEVDLATSSCRVDFDLVVCDPAVMARVFVESTRVASSAAGRGGWAWRRRPAWSSLTVYRSRGAPSLWETHADESGRVRLRHERAASDREAWRCIADELASLDGVEWCRASRWSRSITVDCGAVEGSQAGRTLCSAERILEGRTTVARPAADAPAGIVAGWRRLPYLAAAGGAFGMTLVALAIPGVPTVPFLLATSYYLARSSPFLDDRLRRAPLFGPILREWEGHAALSFGSKENLIGLTVMIVVVGVMLTPLTPIALGLILVVSSISVYGIAATPGLESDRRGDDQAEIGSTIPFPTR
ncbi:DUF454 family protein [Paludisphaera mucosa]|uniref:DUF454 family protein n=1 Tax=Paludisphaera mucosa TaxID=3030827 RepID=A0ABT6FHS2_9BACT|nr:DUF454 family protein [Paludisphaera mucosa]MDG3007110.1 DUF454 family protein [Paludisphaera mucosa]